MVRGQPDFGAYQRKTVGATLADMGDLAVRLGSIVDFDRRGDIVYLDDFEDTILKWSQLGDAGGSAVLDSATAKSGSQSVKFTTGAFLNDNWTMTKSFVILGTLRVGIEISLCDLGPNCDLTFSIAYWDGAAGRQARIWFDRSASTFYIEDAVVGNWTLITTIGTMRVGEHLFYPIKLVADFTTNLHERFLFGGAEYDLSAIAIPPVALAGGEYFRARLNFNAAAAAIQNAWVDDFILTQNEP